MTYTKAEKLQKALELGFIERRFDGQGQVHHEITEKGLLQWQFEKMFGTGK